MKKLSVISFTLLMAMLSIFSCKNNSKSADDNQEMNFKTMIVEYNTSYEMMGVKMTETETKWIDSKNKKEATHSIKSSVVMGVETNEETLNISDGKWSYTINLKDKTGTKVNMEDMQDMAKMFAGMMDVDANGLKDFIEKNGGKVLPNESFLGKDCSVFDFMGTKNWMYKGVVLKSMMGDKVMKEAVRVEENVSIPSDKFDVPQGISITEVKNLMEGEE